MTSNEKTLNYKVIDLVESCKFHTKFISIRRPVHLAYQPPVSSTFLSEQTSHQQSAKSIFLSQQISTSHQPNEQATSPYKKLLFFKKKQIDPTALGHDGCMCYSTRAEGTVHNRRDPWRLVPTAMGNNCIIVLLNLKSMIYF
jgi:hypothetical protein